MIRLACVIGHGHELLPHFIEHYSKYVDELNFIIYESEASPRILSRSKPIIESYKNCKIVKVVRDRVFDWEKVTILYNMIKSKKKNDWWVIADIDEFHLYPNNDLESLLQTCDENYWSIVRGGFVDRIGPDGTFPKINQEEHIFKTFPYAGFFRYPMSDACPNKIAVVKGNIEITNGQHYANLNGHTTWRWQGWSHPAIAPYITHSVQVHHFKWDETCIRRIKSVADVNQPYAFSKEYFKMYESLRKSDFKLNIKEREYQFLKCEKPEYSQYKHWDKLIRKIVSI
jgi:hypothetical protein